MIKDINGNTYTTVKIGHQTWMAENLKVTQFRNGDTIPFIADADRWATFSSAAYCYYNNNNKYILDYGLLYNWYTVVDNRQISPQGWHLPSEEELNILMANLGGDTVAASNMKASGFTHWLTASTENKLNSGFAALPGGYRLGINGTYHTMGSNAYFWGANKSYEMFDWTKRMYTGFADVKRDNRFYTYGLAIRCIKD